jgi:hypothetical protein
MVSWRCVSARLSSGELSGVPASFKAVANLVEGVVVDKRRTVDTGVEAGAQALHQSRSVHVAISNANAAFRHGLGDERRSHVGKAEAKRRNAFGQASSVVNAVDDGAGSLQDFEHLERKCSFVFLD